MDNRKVGIIGTGNVGATLAFILGIKNICSSIVLKDLRNKLAQAMALDISHSIHALQSKTKVIAVEDSKDFNNCDIVVITAGIARKPGMSRDDLLLINAKIMTEIVSDVITYNPNAILIIVSNPLDAMVYKALEISKWQRNRVIGMAGILDCARMSHCIENKLNYGIGEIDAHVIGGHGDDMVPLPTFSTVCGVALNKILSKDDIGQIIDETKTAGAKIVNLLGTGSAYYAPATSTSIIIDSIFNDKKTVYPCSVMLEGEYGYSNLVAGVPVVLGKNGIEKVIEIDLDAKEKYLFSASVASVEKLINTLKQKN